MRVASLATLLVLAACGARTGLLLPDGAAPSDFGALDGGGRDLASADLARPDLFATDLGARDLGPDVAAVDLGARDLGPLDGGPPAILRGVRAELPCTGPLSGSLCPAPDTTSDSATLMGAPGVTYDVAFRVRGVTEGRTYTCSATAGSFCTSGGTPSRTDVFNIWGIAIDVPAQQYYLNLGPERADSLLLDDVHVLRMTDGATITVTGDSVNGREYPNQDTSGRPVVVAGIPPAPLPFDGEFIQIDVLSIAPAP